MPTQRILGELPSPMYRALLVGQVPIPDWAPLADLVLQCGQPLGQGAQRLRPHGPDILLDGAGSAAPVSAVVVGAGHEHPARSARPSGDMSRTSRSRSRSAVATTSRSAARAASSPPSAAVSASSTLDCAAMAPAMTLYASG